jgi:hypothetical protein
MLVLHLLVALVVFLSCLSDVEGFQLSSQVFSRVKPVFRSKYSSFSTTDFKRPTSTQLYFQPTLQFSASSYDSVSSSSLLSTVSPAAAAVSPVEFKVENSKAQPQPARKTMKKIFPLSLMLFCILFNYTILRDTKDVLVVTAPNSGAEIIPFLKTYVNFPSSILITILYGYLSNKMSSEKVFYVLISGFLSFFGAFAGLICKWSYLSRFFGLSVYPLRSKS